MRLLFAERLGALNDRWLRWLRIIDERAEAPEMQDVPGGKTGLLRCRRKSMGFGENRMIVNEFSVDTGLLRALLALEKQAAREVGDWAEKLNTQEERLNERASERWNGFRADIDGIWRQFRNQVNRSEIANRAARVRALNDRSLRLSRIIDERAEAPEMQDVPGGKTGLLHCRRKSMGFGENRMIVNEFPVDTGLLRACRALERQAAREVADWEKKPEEAVEFNGELADWAAEELAEAGGIHAANALPELLPPDQ